MKTERHNVAGRMIIKALRKSPWGAGLVNTDIGSGDRYLDSPPAVLMLYPVPYPNPLLCPPAPSHIMYHAAPYRGPAQLPTPRQQLEAAQRQHADLARLLVESCDITQHPTGCGWDLF
eukprot:1149665-Pelagomonas_calceolata.AAC.6